MLVRSRRPSRSVDYLLSALSPRDVASMAGAYLRGRDSQDLYAEIQRSAGRMRPAERAGLALALGHPGPPSDFTMAEPSVPLSDLLATIEMQRAVLSDEFAAFVERNPRVIRTLDPVSIRAILLPVIHQREAHVDGIDIPDDAPYASELASALYAAFPTLTIADAHAALRTRMRKAGRAATVPFIAVGRAVAAIGRGVMAIARALSRTPGYVLAGLLLIGRMSAWPFVQVARAATALARALAAAPAQLLRLLLAVARALAWPLIALQRGVAALARGSARITRHMLRAVTLRTQQGTRAVVAAGAALDILRARAQTSIHAAADARTSLLQRATAVAVTGFARCSDDVRAARNAAPAVSRILALPLGIAISVLLLATILATSLHQAPHRASTTVAEAAVVHPATMHHHHAIAHVKKHARTPVRRQSHHAHRTPVRIARAVAPRRFKPRQHSRVALARPHRSTWKFGPRSYRYSHPSRVAFVRHRKQTQFARSRQGEPLLVQRARLIVSSYLASVRRGDAGAALGNLGLSANAPVSNLTEVGVVAPASRYRIVRAAMRDERSVKIDVVINAPAGRYFGVYTVKANGPAAWITDHVVIRTPATIAAHR